ncbi:tetratricopeptide repeat protein [Thermodesulfobacteriota bacterium]
MADEGFKRKLTAILSADVEGYSRLMGEDEEATIRTLTAYRSAIAKLVQQYRGRVVDSPGDNILSEFSSAVDAINCAVEIQRELAERNAELPYNRKMQFRIGINVGDVVEEEGRIYGDGVNIAARVESMSQAGGICISGRAYDQVSNKLGLEYENLGEHQVKNISTPIRVYRVLSFPGAAAHRVIKAKKTLGKKWLWAAASTIFIILIIFAGLYWKYFYLPAPIEIASESKIAFNLSEGTSIAVLPLDNMSKDPDQEYFCDGITENITAVLSHIPKLMVIARNSAFAYKGKSINVQQIGRELGAQYVIEGSIQKSDDRVRITVQLIDTKSGHHMWSERYDRKLKDIFKLQDEIAIAIAKAMQIHLTDGEIAKTRFKDIPDLQTYIKALKTLEYIRHNTKESIFLARKEAEELISLHPEASDIYTLLGLAYVQGIELGICESDLICFGKATEATRKALSLDSNNSDAHILASWLFLMRKEHEKAIVEAKNAIMLNPNNADAHSMLGWALIISDRSVEAIGVLKRAIRLNPIPPVWYLSNLAWAYRVSKQYENAIETYKKCLRRQSDFWLAYVGLALSYHFLGRQEEARAAVKEALILNPDHSITFVKKQNPYKNQAELERVVEALRKVGLPE